jgi:two-component system OmpR family sensor kinase
MFSRLFFHLFLVISTAILFAVIILDDLYITGVKKDELGNTRGIDQIVMADISLLEDKNSRLIYWSQRFNYQFSLSKLTEIELTELQQNELLANKVLVIVESGFTVDDISLFYYHTSCECVLVMAKNYGAHNAFQQYLQSFLIIIILALAMYIFYYANSHKKQVKKLVNVYQNYGSGQFSVRANSHTPQPYTPLAITFNQMAEEIRLLIEEQRTLVHGVSHDLRTPIARMRFALDMTRSCNTISEFQLRLQDMDLDLDELDTLVDEWLFYAELNGKAEKITLLPVNLAELAQQTTEKIQVLFPQLKFELALQPHYLAVNDRLIIRALENLLTNAGKFAKTRIKVSLYQENSSSAENLLINERLSKTETRLCLMVEDDGSGLPEELTNKIIQPFTKLDDSRNTSGFGLGLAIVKSIIDKHQAQLQINTSTLGGASFSIYFNESK